MLTLAQEEGLIKKKEINHLQVLDYNTPVLYIIPKLHKDLTNPLGRPIVSAINVPPKRVGQYVNSLLKTIVPAFESKF